MATFIVLRLVPATPVAQGSVTATTTGPATYASPFASQYLEGLTVSVYDASFKNPDAGTQSDPNNTNPIGVVSFSDPAWTAVVSGSNTTYLASYGTSGIVQSWTVTATGIELMGVATALIPYNPQVAPSGVTLGPISPEYETPDLRVKLAWAGKPSVYGGGVYYDVMLLDTGSGPAPDPSTTAWSTLAPIAAYITIPTPPNSNGIQFSMPTNGNAPGYAGLLAAINQVMASDPGTPSNSVANWFANNSAPPTVDQCRNIAYEILWGPQPPLPTPPEALESMYTNPPNTGGSGSTDEQNRQDWIGSLNAHYSTLNAQAEQLTSFVYAVFCTYSCELQSKGATSAILTFPVNPNGAATTLRDDNGSGGDPHGGARHRRARGVLLRTHGADADADHRRAALQHRDRYR